MDILKQVFPHAFAAKEKNPLITALIVYLVVAVIGTVVGFLVTALIFVIGHGLNIFMNILGSMVHPMRLTFVEFFKNSGYEGGGRAYKPFKK
jgi:vacuolar-type H+-ATPase subunit I/STV1